MQQLDSSNISQFSKKISFWGENWVKILQTFFHDMLSDNFFEIMSHDRI